MNVVCLYSSEHCLCRLAAIAEVGIYMYSEELTSRLEEPDVEQDTAPHCVVVGAGESQSRGQLEEAPNSMGGRRRRGCPLT